MRRAFLYLRVSTEEQSRPEHHSLDYQEDHGRKYAKTHGWRVAKVRKDIGSGKDDDREAYQELLADIESGAIDVIITYRLDRLSRNVRDVYDLLQRTGDAGIGFVSTSEHFDTTTAMGRAMLGVAAVFAQLTREMIGENVRDGLAKRAQAGKYTGATGNPRFGYQYSREEGKLLVEPREAEVVRLAFDLCGTQKWSMGKIARHLNREGHRTKRGKQWNTAILAPLLRSPLYVGKVSYKGEVYDGEHEPIVDRELFDVVQSLLEERKMMPPRTQHSPHLLSGIARCGKCGWRLVSHRQYHRVGGKRKAYRSYQHRANTKTGPEACKGFTKSADKFEGVVIDKIRELAASTEFQEAAFAEAQKQLASDMPGIVRERDEVQLKLAEMADKFGRWADRLDRGQIDEEQFTTRNAELLEKKARLQERLAELDAKAAEGESVEVGLQEVREMLSSFDAVWSELTLDEQRELLRSLVDELSVSREKAELKLLLMPPVEISLEFKRGRSKQAVAE